jgi:hypothetical protein
MVLAMRTLCGRGAGVFLVKIESRKGTGAAMDWADELAPGVAWEAVVR